MIIRPADLEKDALAIMDGARNFASRIAVRHLLPSDDGDFVKAVSRIVSLDGMEILLAEHEGRVVGGIGVLYIQFLWNPAILIADELFWWSATDSPFRTGRRLADEAMLRIKERGAIPMFRSLTTSPPGVEKFYRSIDLFPIETVFTWPSPPLPLS